MPHQCVHCSKIYPNASKELLEGCECGSHFFFFIKDEQAIKLKQAKEEALALNEPLPISLGINEDDKKQIEHDVREIMGIDDEETPVILDLESVRVLGPGKFEIDLVRLFNTKRPIVYKLEEGKYIIDLASTFKEVMDGK